MTPRTAHSIRRVVVASLALYVLAALLLPPLLAWARAHLLETWVIATCGGVVALYWYTYRQGL